MKGERDLLKKEMSRQGDMSSIKESLSQRPIDVSQC